jgi:SAM-dependent methyltransferase
MDCLFPEHAYDACVIQQPMVQTPERSQLMPSEGVLALHDHHQRYANFNDFQPQIAGLLQQGSLLAECIQVTKALGFLEPLTGEHIPPEAIQIQGPNYRESLIANGLLSRNRAVLVRLEQLYGSIEDLRRQEVYLVEAISGFAVWLRRKLEAEKLVCSEYLEDAEKAFSDIPHQDLCALTFPDSSFDLVLCNELFEHVQDLDLAFREIARVLRPGGRLLSTFPLAFGQQESIKKALYNSATGESVLIDEAEYHGDPVRPEAGSLVYRIPGWEVQDQLQAAGFADVAIHHIVSWKHGVLGSDLPGVLVVEAQR